MRSHKDFECKIFLLQEFEGPQNIASPTFVLNVSKISHLISKTQTLFYLAIIHDERIQNMDYH